MIRILNRVSVILVFWGAAAAGLRAESWALKLGYPAGHPVVILDARGVGVAWEMNEAAKELLADGRISSAGVVVTGPWFREMADWARKHDAPDLGVSVAMTNPYPGLTWRLLTSERGPTSLVDANGFPWTTPVQFAVTADPHDVKDELDAQIARAREAGIKPTHIGGYFGTMYTRSDLVSVLLGASRKYWLPAPVLDLTPELIERFRAEGFPVDDEMIQLLNDYPLPKLDDIRFSPAGTTYEDKCEKYAHLVHSLPHGLTQIIFRPAVDSQGLRLLTDDWQQRVWDRQLLLDDSMIEMMKEAGVVVTSWREVMQRFEGAIPVPQDVIDHEQDTE